MSRLRAITNLQGDVISMNESSLYGIEIEHINTSIYTHEFLNMVFKCDEFQANDIYSMLVRDSYYNIDSIGV